MHHGTVLGDTNKTSVPQNSPVMHCQTSLVSISKFYLSYSFPGRVLYSHSQKRNRNSKKKGGFLSSSSRFKERNGETQRGTTPGNILRSLNDDRTCCGFSTQIIFLTFCYTYVGPGQYEAPVYQPKQGGLMVTKDARFKTQKSNVPGPGNYEVRFP